MVLFSARQVGGESTGESVDRRGLEENPTVVIGTGAVVT